MTGTLMILLLLLCGSQASHYYGTVMTFTTKENTEDGFITVICNYKNNFRSCTDNDAWSCASGNCGTETLELNVVDKLDGEWCQREGVMTRRVSATAQFQLRLASGDWISGIKNKVSNWRALTKVDLRIRSDMDKPNRSPQTTVLPSLRVPSNCRRDFEFLAFDPDGDEVRCRYGSAAECNPCSPASVLTILTSCTLSFQPTSSSNEGPWAVQLEVEDFPRQTISLVQSDGMTTTKTQSDALSKIPVRFALIVDPAVTSCTDGLYLPKFLPPTPDSRAQLDAYINQSLEITIKAEATSSKISEVYFSGPHTTTKQTVSDGLFLLSWTPSEEEDGEHHPICFVVQAELSSSKYHSELRCVVVSVSAKPPTTVPPTTPSPPTTTTTTTTTTTPQTPEPSTSSLVLEKSLGSDEENSGTGKVVGIVCGVGIGVCVVVIAALAVKTYLQAGHAGI